MVKLYGKPGCGGCIATERALKKYNIDFEKINIYEDEEAFTHIQNLGYQGVPVVETEDEHWIGYKEDKIKALGLA